MRRSSDLIPFCLIQLEEMNALARMYTAVARSRADLGRARTFLYDCLYFFPPQAFALTYTIISVWAEVLRPVSFPTGTNLFYSGLFIEIHS